MMDEADAKRHKADYRDDNLYVTVVPEKCEVFISSVQQDQDPLTGAALDAISRLVTLAWKSSDLNTVVTQLSRASRSTRDIPGILLKFLKECE